PTRQPFQGLVDGRSRNDVRSVHLSVDEGRDCERLVVAGPCLRRAERLVLDSGQNVISRTLQRHSAPSLARVETKAVTIADRLGKPCEVFRRSGISPVVGISHQTKTLRRVKDLE